MDIKLMKFKMIEEKTNKYNEFTFLKSVNIITGDNTKGKSTLIKAIMYTLGFDIIKWAAGFSIDDFILQLHFSVDEVEHELMRKGDIFILDRGKPSIQTSSFKEDFNSLFDIQLKLAHKNNKTRVSPYPTDTLLFSYVDQDSSFHDLFKGNHNSNLMYKPNEIYRIYRYFLGIENIKLENLKSKKARETREKKNIEQKLKIHKEMINSVSSEGFIPINTEELTASIEIFIKDLKFLLKEKNSLEDESYKLIKKMKDLDIEKKHLEDVYEELSKNSSEISCEFCHSPILEETFTANYKKEMSKSAILGLYASNKKENLKEQKKLTETENKIKELIIKIEKNENAHSQAHNEIDINKILELNANFKYKEKIEKRSSIMGEKIEEINQEIKNIEKKIRTEDKRLKSNKTTIKTDYNNILNNLSKVFDKTEFKWIKDKFMDFRIKDAGAQNNIVYIATYYIYFQLLNKYSKLKFPIIWDTLIKETFDNNNIDNLNTFVNENLLKMDNQILISNIPDGKDVDIIESKNYNYISIGSNNICWKENSSIENELIDYIFKAIK